LFKQIAKYGVVVTLLAYLVAIAGAISYANNNQFMLVLMGLFFLIFSFFKVIHLVKFEKSFSRYDPIAKTIPGYGYLYPFLEITLGLLYLLNTQINIAAIMTIIILGATTIGVMRKLREGEIIECACLGVVFGIPLSTVTIFENLAMITMAVLLII